MRSAKEFFEALYGDLGEEEYIEIRSIKGGRTKRMFMNSHTAAAKAVNGLMANADIYFGVATRDGKGGKKDNIVRIPAVWADLDNKDGLPPMIERLDRTDVLLPSAQVISGYGIHLYWFLNEPAGKEQVPLIETINKRIADWLDGDTVHDAARVLRVPGTLNHKRDRPVEVRLAVLYPERKYSIEHMCEVVGVAPQRTQRDLGEECGRNPLALSSELASVSKRAGEGASSTSFDTALVPRAYSGLAVSPGTGNHEPGHPPLSPQSSSLSPSLPCRQRLWQGVSEGGRNNACFQLAVDLKKQGMPVEAAVETLSRWNLSNIPPMEPSQIASTVKSAYSGSYIGLGCDKQPMCSFCSGSCPVRRKNLTAENAECAEVLGGRSEAPLALSSELASVSKCDGQGTSAPSFDTLRYSGLAETVPHESSTINHPPSPDLSSFDDYMEMEVPEVEFLVEGLVPRNGVTLLTGEGGIGKSFLMIDMACAVASGSKFLDRFTCRQGPVVIVDLENHDSAIARRIRKIAAGRSDYGPGMQVYFIKKRERPVYRLAIDEEHTSNWLAAVVEKASPALVVIDPLVAAHSRDENDNVAMRDLFLRLQEVSSAYDTAVLVVHHPRKRGMVNDAGQMIRGASDLRNAVDSHIFLRKINRGTLLVEHDKSRHSPELPNFRIKMVDDPARSSITFLFDGETSEVQEKSAEARECILSMLKNAGECTTGELVGAAHSQGLAKRTVEQALNSLLADGQINKPRRGIYVTASPTLEVDE